MHRVLDSCRGIVRFLLPVLTLLAMAHYGALAQSAPVITLHPVDGTACEGGTISFTAAATGDPAPTAQWFVSTNGGGTWAFINGAAAQSNSIAFTVSKAQNGHKFRVAYTNEHGSVTSDVGTMHVHYQSEITEQPEDETRCENTTTGFHISVTGNPEPTIQWQISTNSGGTWLDITGLIGPDLEFNADMPHNGNLFRATVTNSCGGSTLISDTVMLTVHTPPSVTTNPSTQQICEGSTVTFTAAATGPGDIAVQWQESTNNGTDWSNMDGQTNTTLSFPANSFHNNRRYRARFFNACTTNTESATLTVITAPQITTNPLPATVCHGTPVSFSAGATASGSPKLQWQVSTNGGSSWDNVVGGTGTTLSFTAATSMNGYRYRANFTNSCSTSTASQGALLTVNGAAAITSQPQSQAVCAGAACSVSVAASGEGLTYQWRRNGVNIPGAVSSSYPITNATSAHAGLYTVAIGSSCSATPVISSPANVTVLTKPSIMVQPLSRTVCAGSSVTFSVTATGTALSYQWWKGTDSIPGANSSSYTIPVVDTNDAAPYKVVVSGTCTPSVTSTNATLTVRTAPAITAHPVGGSVPSGTPLTLSVTATGSNLLYQWKKNGTNISGATSRTYRINSVTATTAGSYTVAVSGTCAPAQTSDPAVVTVATSKIAPSGPASSDGVTGERIGSGETLGLSVHPNPARNQATLNLQLPPDAEGNRALEVYDVTGRMVLDLTDRLGTASRQEVPVDLSGLAGGHYYVRFRVGSLTTVEKTVVVTD